MTTIVICITLIIISAIICFTAYKMRNTAQISKDIDDIKCNIKDIQIDIRSHTLCYQDIINGLKRIEKVLQIKK